MQFNVFLNQGKTDTGAAVYALTGFIGFIEMVEDIGQIGGIDATA